MCVGGIRRWSVALVSRAGGDGMVMLVQYFAEEAAPGLPNEGREPTERGSVARLLEQLDGDDADDGVGSRAGRQAGRHGKARLDVQLVLVYTHHAASVRCCEVEGREA